MRAEDFFQSSRLAFLPCLQLFKEGNQRVWVISGCPHVLRAEPGQLANVMKTAEEYLGKNRSRIIEFTRTFGEQKKRTYSSDIAMVKLLTAVIIVLSLVTGLGIVGLAWFSVSQRRKQIGTRRALGATRGDIIKHFMLENWLITTAGLVLGVVGAMT